MTLQTCLPVYAAAESATENIEERTTGPETQEQSAQITARVPAATASYYITLPEEISLGSLDSTSDYQKDYELGVTVESLGDLKLKITSDRRITYTNTDDTAKTLTGYNAFGTQYFSENGTAEGTLTVYKEDIGQVPKGTYTGTMKFYTSLVTGTGETEDGSEDEKDTDTSGTVTDGVNGGNGNGGSGVTEKSVTAHVLVEQNGQIKENREESMCWPFFHEKADLKLRDDGMVDVVLYLIDPIPGAAFSSYGTPLKHFYVSGATTDITVENMNAIPADPDSKVTLHPSDDSFGMEASIDHEHPVTKHFVKDRSNGIFVSSDGDYPSAPVRFTVPLSAVKSSENGTILLTAYVTPMTVWKQFFLVLDDVDDLGSGGDSDEEEIKSGYTVEKSQHPSAGVNGLKDYVQANGEGYYTFRIETADSVGDREGISEIASLISAGQVSGVTTYYDLSLECETGSEVKQITDTGTHVMEVRLPLVKAMGQDLSVYRCHNGQAGLMQALSARKTSGHKDNTYYADWASGYLYIYTSKFSVYAVHQSPLDTGTGDGTGSGDTGTNGSGTGGTSANEKDGNYTCKVSMRKNDDINTVSMCNALFYSQADLKVSGNNTKVTLYVIDPIPNYASEGTPLSNVKFIANGKTYSASVDSGNKVSRYFGANEQFISKAGNYYASPITVTIPTSAVENSKNGKVKFSAYVNAVMNSTQEFYVVFSDWEKGETESSGEAEEIDETAGTTTDTTAAGTGTAAGISTASTSSGSLKDGEYLIPVTAVKEKTDDVSMMADYMYSKAALSVSGSSLKLTIYIQHTVAGIEGGGPEWLSYNGTKAVKETNAAQFGGVAYDSFTLTLKDTVPSPMLVSMLIKAMNLEVKCRLVFDFNKMTSTDGKSLTEALEESAAEQGTDGTGSGPAADSGVGTNMTTAEGTDGETAGGGSSGLISGAGYQLVTDAGILSILFLLLTALAGAGAAAVYWLKKRRY